MATDSMRDYWDARAQEDPFFFVDNRLHYRAPDLERFWEGGREAVRRMSDALGAEVAEGDAVVEIGCGAGRMTRVFAEPASRVWALDVSEKMLEVARELNAELDNVEWLLGDGRTLTGVPDACADVCQSHVVFQHIPDPEITLGYVTEMGRVLRPGGWAAFQISNEPSFHRRRPLRERVPQALRALTGRAPRGQDHPAWRGSAVDLGRLREVADRAGMDVERVVGEGTPLCLVLLRRRDG